MLLLSRGLLSCQTEGRGFESHPGRATEDGLVKAGDTIDYFATGLSCVMHPRNPMAPTMHFNYRYFETDVEGMSVHGLPTRAPSKPC